MSNNSVTIDETSAAVATLSQVSGQHGIRRISNEFDNLARSMLSIDDVSKRTDAQLKSMGINDAASFQTVDMRAKDMGLTFDKLAFSGDTFIQKLQYLAQLSGYSADQYNSSRADMILTQYGQIQATKGEAQAQAWLNMQQNEGSARFMKMIGGAAAFIPALILLSGKSKEYNYILQQMKSPADTVTDAFNNMRNTLAQSLKMLEIRFQNILIVIGLQIIPVITAFAKSLLGAVDGIMAFVQSSQGMDTMKYMLIGLAAILSFVVVPAIGEAVIAAAPFTLTMIAVAGGAILLGKAISAMVEHFGGMSNIMRAIQPAIVFIQQGFNQLGTDLHKSLADPNVAKGINDLKQGFTEMLPSIKIVAMIIGGILLVAFRLFLFLLDQQVKLIPIVVRVIGGLVLVIGTISQAIVNFVTHIPQLWQQAWAAITKHVGDFFNTLGTKVHDGINGVLVFFIQLPRRVIGALEQTMQAVLTELPKIPMQIAYAVGYGLGLLVKLFVFTWTQLPLIIVHAGGAILGAIGTLIGNMMGRLGEMRDRAVERFNALKVAALVKVTELVLSIPQKLTDLKTNAIALFHTLAIEVPLRLNELRLAATTKAQELATAIIAEIQKLPGQAKDAIGNFIQGLVDGIKNGTQWVLDAIKHLGGNMIQGFRDALGIHSPSQKMHDNGVLVMQGLVNGIASMRGQVAGAFASATSPLTGGLALGGLSGPTGGGLGVAGGLALAGDGRGGDTIHINLPNATGSPTEIATAIGKVLDDRERANYRAARRPGGYQGLRGGI